MFLIYILIFILIVIIFHNIAVFYFKKEGIFLCSEHKTILSKTKLTYVKTFCYYEVYGVYSKVVHVLH